MCAPQLKLADLLYIPPPPAKQTITQGSGRVLTSVTHIKMMEEKLRKKEEEAELKEQRKKERSRKKALKEAEKQRKEKERLLKKGTVNLCNIMLHIWPVSYIMCTYTTVVYLQGTRRDLSHHSAKVGECQCKHISWLQNLIGKE